MASESITFSDNLDRLFYTCYRPIVVKVSCSDTDVAFIRAELMVQQNPGGSFISTGVLINAYEDLNINNRYAMNIMEYCRPYVSRGLTPIYTFPGFSIHPAYVESCRFYVHAWPVRYSSTGVGQLVDDMAEGKDSKQCIVVGLNTDEKTTTGGGGDYQFIDKYVLNKNGDTQVTDIAMPLTNQPFVNYWQNEDPLLEQGGYPYWPSAMDDPRPDAWGISVDMSDHHAASIYYLNGEKNQTRCTIINKDLNGNMNGFSSFIINYPSIDVDMQRILWHPLQMEAFVTFHTGSAWNNIIDASGNLVSSGVMICLATLNTTSSQSNSWMYTDPYTNNNLHRWMSVNYSDIGNGLGPCGISPKERIRLHWKNSLGGYDFFNFYGTQEKSVKTKGARYDKFNDNHTWRGFRGETDLWVKRTDEWSVLSQPVNKVTAIWLEELVASPLVWMEVPQINQQRGWGNGHLIPVNITPGSYKTFNSEDKQYFIEIKFALANDRTQQKG